MAGAGVRGPRQDEQEVGQAVQIDERRAGSRRGRRCRRALRARRVCRWCARRGAARRPRPPPGSTKLLSSGSSALKRSQSGSSCVDLLLRDAQPAFLLERHGEIGAEVEELVLDADEHLANRTAHTPGEHEPESRVQLVDGPVGGDPRVELRYARAVAERRLAGVAAACVDLRQPYRLVALARHGRTLGACSCDLRTRCPSAG